MVKQRVRLLTFSAFLFFSVIQVRAANTAPVDSLIINLEQALDVNDLAAACSVSHQISTQLWIKGQVDSSLQYSEKTYNWAVELKDTAYQIKGLNNSAYSYQQKSDLNKAIAFFEKAIALCQQSRDTLQWANTLESLSTLYGSTGLTNYPRSIELLLKAAKLKENAEAYNLLPGTYKNISTIFKEMKDTVNREKYLLKAVDLVEKGQVMHPTFQAAVYNEAGRFYTDEKIDYDNAWNYFQKVLEVSEKIDWKKGISVSLSNMANVKELQGEYTEAASLLEKALQIKTEIDDYYGIINTHCVAGEIHEKLHEYNQAIEHFEKARDLAMEKKLSNEIKKSYEGLYRLNRKMGNYHTALGYHEKYTALADSLSGAEHKKAVAEIETKFETEKKEQQIEKLTAEKEIEGLKARQRSLIAIILGSLLLFIALAAYLIIHQKNITNIKRESELNQKLLRSQMNPHFVFNALGTIQNYIYNKNPDDAARYLAKFAKLMRNILESSINEFIPIEQELETVTNYLTLQQIRSTENFHFEVTTDGDFQGEEIPPMLAQPFIENAVKHAFNPSITDAMIKVRYIFNDDTTCIVIEDNGTGINSTKKKKKEDHKSHAIELTCERLSLFNRKKRKQSSIDITDLSENGGRGTRVEICFKQS